MPFHFSISGRLGEVPTEIHAVGDVQETLANVPPPAGFGVDWMDQREPFQRSANVIETPSTVTNDPTAKHFVSAGQETPLNAAFAGASATSFVFWNVQRESVQRPTMIIGGLYWLSCHAAPTATQSERDGQETPAQ
jgi:hypothetical protein